MLAAFEINIDELEINLLLQKGNNSGLRRSGDGITVKFDNHGCKGCREMA